MQLSVLSMSILMKVTPLSLTLASRALTNISSNILSAAGQYLRFERVNCLMSAMLCSGPICWGTHS